MSRGELKHLHWPDKSCIQFYFNSHSSYCKLSLLPTALQPASSLSRRWGSWKSHFIKKKKCKNNKKLASMLRLEELDSLTIAGPIHIKLNKEQTATRRWAERLCGHCLSLILCWLSPVPCQKGLQHLTPVPRRGEGAGDTCGNLK